MGSLDKGDGFWGAVSKSFVSCLHSYILYVRKSNETQIQPYDHYLQDKI